MQGNKPVLETDPLARIKLALHSEPFVRFYPHLFLGKVSNYKFCNTTFTY